jgi:hypothetical protein
MARSRTWSGIRQVWKRLGWRQASRLERAVQGVVEPLERRVLMSTFTVTVTGDSSATPGTLPYEIAQATSSTGAAIVNFDSGLSGDTIQLNSDSTLLLQGGTCTSISIVGLTNSGSPAITISGDGASVFDVYSGVTATLSNLNITNGTASSATGNNGGGIYNQANLTIENCDINGDSAGANGGGICDETGVLTITGGSISSDTAGVNGGGISSYEGTIYSIDGCEMNLGKRL